MSRIIKPDASFTPRELFARMQGAWLEPRIGSMWQENTGVTPTVSGGQTIGKLVDLSAARVASQATAANRPLFGARRNLLTYTEDFSNVIWGKSVGITVTNNAGIAPDGTNTAASVVYDSGSLSFYQGITNIATAPTMARTYSVWVKGTAGETIGLWVTSSEANSLLTHTLSGVWQKLTGTISPDSNPLYINCDLRSTGTARSVLVWHPQLELGSTATDYQRVTTATDYDAGRFPAIRHADSTDVLAAAMPAINERRNLLTYSEQFDNAAWNSQLATATLAGVTSTGRAYYSLIVTAGSAFGNKQQPISKASSALTYTCSVYAKAGTFSYLQMAVFSGGNGVRTWYNLTAGAKGTSGVYGSGFTLSDYTIAPDVDGFYRCTLTLQSDATSGVTVYINANSANSLTGPASSGSDNIYISGAQLELGSVATDYQKITDWTSEAYSSSGSTYFATPTGMSCRHNQSIGTTYNLPALQTDIYGIVITPARLVPPLEKRLELYMLRLAGLIEPDYLLDDAGDILMTDDNEFLLRA